MGNKLLIQVILILTSVTIIVTYIRPAFADIALIQDDIARYNNTVSKASELNAALQDLVSTERSISPQELRSLQTYLPSQINDVLIMRDIQNIFKSINVPISTLTSVSTNAFQSTVPMVEGATGRMVPDQSTPSMIFRDFQLSFFGTYDHLKIIMQGLEINAYPLEVVEVLFVSPQDPANTRSDFGLPPGVMKIDMTLRAFALPGS